jgi:uncharacterized protein HemX
MQKFGAGLVIGLGIGLGIALFYRHQLQQKQRQQQAQKAAVNADIAEMDAEWEKVPTDRKIRVALRMAELGYTPDET